MKRLFPRQKYIRIFLALCILFSLVSIPFVYVISRQFSTYAMKQIDKSNQTEVVHAQENSQFVFKKMIGYGLNMYQDKSIQRWLTDKTETPEHQVDAMKAAANYTTTEPFIDNIYLFNMRSEHAINLKFGITSFAGFSDQTMLDIVKQPRKSYLNFLIYETNGQKKLALVIPTVPSGQLSFGYLVMLLDMDLLQQYLLKDNRSTGTRSFILNRDGQVMLGSGETADLYAELSKKSGQGTGSFAQTYDGELWSVQYAQIEPQGWIIYQIAKYDQILADFNSFRNKMLTFAASFVVLLLVILFWNSRRTYKPFSQLADQLEMKFGLQLKSQSNEGPREEYKVIRYGIEMLASQVDKMDTSMREHKSVIKLEYLRQWIVQGKLIAPVEQYLREQTALFEGDGLHLCVIRINEYSLFEDQYNFASRKLMKYAIGNIAEEIMNRHRHSVSVDLGGDHLALLISGSDMPMDKLVEILDDVSKQIGKWTRIGVTIAASGVHAFGDDLRGIYNHIYELTMLKFISGEDKIYLEQDFEAYMERVQPLPDEQLLEELIKRVRMGKAEEVTSSLDEIFGHMQTMHYADSKFQLSLILYTLFKTFNKLPSVENVEGIESILERFDTLGGVKGWLAQELLAIIDDLSNKKGSSRRDEIVTEIVEYVKTHLHDPLLTIDEISEHVSLSTRYIRQLFKEVYETTLSDYIMEERINRVKTLLETTDWTVTDIGERSGFQTKSNFFTTFKKATGMTPSQYRDIG
ncbi:AraC family transcriptional regulator [Cohnella endophytica]|uniref:AraC family transcriptional regulator n=1 Tax=Cohnella endophytica TaxID=2419778 RepID=A0A494XQN0_9BACL|nr:helix-turn-helix domain-containing protein [Cohnella endophytica]RKP52937.1 AraC family transcriptional regulator [Cohnella endophytica]